MIKLLIKFLLFFVLLSCEEIPKKNITTIVEKSKETIQKTLKKDQSITTKKNPSIKIKNDKSISTNQKPLILKKKNDRIIYLVGDPFFIKGVKYIPQENYSYNKTGLATFYGKELHKIKTANNDLNKVTELLGRHKTLPLPSVVKVTNLENGLSVIVKIIDRYDDNSSIIQVSRKVAQLLKFYKKQITRVRVEILEDPSKQWKNVALSMNELEFNETIDYAPTEQVSISNLDDNSMIENTFSIAEQPIEIGSEPVKSTNLFIKIYNFKTYEEIQNVLEDLNLTTNSTNERKESQYNLILGPINNEEADKLVSSFIMKGYKKIEIILE